MTDRRRAGGGQAAWRHPRGEPSAAGGRPLGHHVGRASASGLQVPGDRGPPKPPARPGVPSPRRQGRTWLLPQALRPPLPQRGRNHSRPPLSLCLEGRGREEDRVRVCARARGRPARSGDLGRGRANGRRRADRERGRGQQHGRPSLNPQNRPPNTRRERHRLELAWRKFVHRNIQKSLRGEGIAW